MDTATLAGRCGVLLQALRGLMVSHLTSPTTTCVLQAGTCRTSLQQDTAVTAAQTQQQRLAAVVPMHTWQERQRSNAHFAIPCRSHAQSHFLNCLRALSADKGYLHSPMCCNIKVFKVSQQGVAVMQVLLVTPAKTEWMGKTEKMAKMVRAARKALQVRFCICNTGSDMCGMLCNTACSATAYSGPVVCLLLQLLLLWCIGVTGKADRAADMHAGVL